MEGYVFFYWEIRWLGVRALESHCLASKASFLLLLFCFVFLVFFFSVNQLKSNLFELHSVPLSLKHGA